MKKPLLFCLALLVSIAIWGDDTKWNFSNQSVTVDDKSYFLDGTNKVAQFYTYESKMEASIVIPSTISYDGVTYAVRSMAGRYNSPKDAGIVTSITLPNTMQKIDKYALYGLTNLRNVHISTNVPPVLDSDFKGSSTIRAKAFVPKGTIHDYRIADSKWNEFVIVDGTGMEVSVNLTTAGTLSSEVVKKVDYLQDVNNLTVSGQMNDADLNVIKNNMPNVISINLADAKLTTISDYWIENKWGVETIVLPKTLENINSYAFQNCYHLNSINFPSSLKKIGYRAFCDCDELTTVKLNEGLTEIGDRVFYSCDNLKEVYLPSSLKKISIYAFEYCGSLTTVSISEGVTEIGEYAFENSGLKSVKTPSSLKTIKDFAFHNCPLNQVELNEGLETLNYYCFGDCKDLKEITLPGTLKYCDKPFYYTTNLKDVYIRAGVPPYVSGTCPIVGVNMSDITLHVPAMTTAIYKSTTGWSDFYTIETTTGYRPSAFATSYDCTLDINEDLTHSIYNPSLDTFYSNWNDESYGTITVNGNGALNLSKYSAYYDYNRWYEYPDRNRANTSLINNISMKADSVNVSLYPRDRVWAFVSFPFNVRVKDIKPLSEGNTSYAIRKYSGENRAMGDMNYTWVKMTADDVLLANQGYIINTERRVNGSTQWYSGLEIPSSDNSVTIPSGNVSVALTAYPSEFTQNQGWNLIGNPYMCYYDTRYMDFTAPITVWNMRNSSYTAYSPNDDSYVLSPGEAFFVQCSGNNQKITFDKDGRQIDREVRNNSNAKSMSPIKSNRKIINLTLNDGERSDRTRIVLNETASASYELDKDASKFISTEAPQIYSVYDGIQYAINERPLNSGNIVLGTYFNANGKYTIALSEDIDTDIILIDTQEGNSVSLNNGMTYTFGANEGYASRFILSVGDATAISNVKTDAANDEGASYNVSGMRINAETKGIRITKNGKKLFVK